MFDYTLCYKSALSIEDEWRDVPHWDIFISAFTSAERVQKTFQRVVANRKIWAILPQYRFKDSELPSEEHYIGGELSEDSYIKNLFSYINVDIPNVKICIDITGFIRPFLAYLLKYLTDRGVKQFDALYSEPGQYKKREDTDFSEGQVKVRQIAGFEGHHPNDNSNDVLIIGAGYESDLIAAVADDKESARKVILLGFPSLRADMYQENVLKTQKAQEETEALKSDRGNNVFFAPAYDPFVTASLLSEEIMKIQRKKPISNLYLCPLATKPQVLGFALYYLYECRNQTSSILFPFTEAYSSETSTGLSRIWRYTVELPSV